MRYLILSDLHLGDPRFEQEWFVFSLLNNEHIDCLVLAGDFYDAWAQPDERKIMTCHNMLLEKVRRMAEQQKVVWVIGNHEILNTPAFVKMKMLVPKAELVDKYVIPHKASEILVVHGYQIEAGVIWLGKLFYRLNLSILKWFGIDLQTAWRRLKGYANRCHRLQTEYARRACVGRYSTLVMGHTHLPEKYITSDNITVVNAGDMLRHHSYVTIDDKDVKLHGV